MCRLTQEGIQVKIVVKKGTLKKVETFKNTFEGRGKGSGTEEDNGL